MIRIYTDGGSRGNPGLSASAFYVPSLDLGYGVPLEDSTNNVAEYRGLIEALKFMFAEFGAALELQMLSDSKLMVEQMKGSYKVKSEALLDLWAEAKVLADQFDKVEYVHVPRGANKIADKIANLTMDWMVENQKKDLGMKRWESASALV